MKKIFVFAASAAAVLAVGCAKNEVIQVVSPDQAVSFGAYAGNTATKAVSATTFGDITTAAILQASSGFGVFGYYSDGAANQYDGDAIDYEYAVLGSHASKFTPNFMYNQLVSYSSQWTYSPIKYWPNEYNNTNAIGADVDKLTFCAYAPYVATAGDEGVTAFSANTAVGDPTITFKVPAKAEEQIDLLWSDANTRNLIKPTTNSKTTFTFKHALSNISVLPVVVVDGTEMKVSAGTPVASGTTVKLNSLTITGPFSSIGKLNLIAGKWSVSDSSNKTVTYNNSGSGLDITSLIDKNTTNTYASAHKVNGGTDPLPEFMFIPTGLSDYVITIDYDFETVDNNLTGNKAVVHNVIHKTLSNLNLQQGRKIKLYVGLGLNSVVFDAEVADWTETESTVWLPVNL